MKFIVLLALVIACACLGFQLTCNILATIFFMLTAFAFLGAFLTAITNLWDAIVKETVKEWRTKKIFEAIEAGLIALVMGFLLQFFF